MAYYEDLIENSINLSEEEQKTKEEKHNVNEKGDTKKPQTEKFITIKKTINRYFKGKYYESVFIKYYYSGNIGTKIVIASSGEKTPYKVGSAYEDLFFTCSCENGKTRMKLFYENPEDYENHNFITLTEDTKIKWMEKYIKSKKRINEMEEERINKMNKKNTINIH